MLYGYVGDGTAMVVHVELLDSWVDSTVVVGSRVVLLLEVLGLLASILFHVRLVFWKGVGVWSGGILGRLHWVNGHGQRKDERSVRNIEASAKDLDIRVCKKNIGIEQGWCNVKSDFAAE